MEARNALLAEMARDAELERTDFLARAGEQLDRFMAAHQHRIQQLGGLVLIDDDPEYLAVAPDGTFRSRSRVFDETRGEWIAETEIIETAAELVEIYNPADILQSFAEAEAEDIGLGEGEAESLEGDVVEGDAGVVVDPYAEAADQWAAGQPEVREAHDESGAALALYELALDYQDRSQRTEAGLVSSFEAAATGVLGYVGTLVIVDDDDEHLAIGAGGFKGRVIAEGDTDWQDISSPDQIVRFYDPTDIFGDLAEALVDAYPAVATSSDAAEADDEAEGDDDDDEADDDGDDDADAEPDNGKA
ncbi:MAG TPA: hypothetical protein VIF63_02570 [Candidatus Limnocylindrales bacterium]|jgi:hypothetical protein